MSATAHTPRVVNFRLVILALAELAGERSPAPIAAETVAERAGLSVDAAQEALHKLKATRLARERRRRGQSPTWRPTYL